MMTCAGAARATPTGQPVGSPALQIAIGSSKLWEEGEHATA
jgi:hypothetical protein